MELFPETRGGGSQSERFILIVKKCGNCVNNCMIHVFLILDLWMQMDVEAGGGATQRAGSSLPGTVEKSTQHEEVPQVPVAGKGRISSLYPLSKICTDGEKHHGINKWQIRKKALHCKTPTILLTFQMTSTSPVIQYMRYTYKTMALYSCN